MAIVSEAADDELKSAARSLSAKIDAVLPQDRSKPPTTFGFAVYPFAEAARGFQHMPAIRAAIRARQKLRIAHHDAEGDASDRTIRPLQLDYWGRVWTATAWCEIRNDFRVFRVDRIDRLTVLPQMFVDEPGKTLADYLATQG